MGRGRFPKQLQVLNNNYITKEDKKKQMKPGAADLYPNKYTQQDIQI